jgi:hypothetical protein
MLSIINQFKRLYSDNGSKDRNFDAQADRLRISLARLKRSTEEVLHASQVLHDTVMSDMPPEFAKTILPFVKIPRE